MIANAAGPPPSTEESAYTQRLVASEKAWWNRYLRAQEPWRWNLRRLDPGYTLDIGCGIGRNLRDLPEGGVGVDHNPHSVAAARSRGLIAFTPDQFEASEFNAPGRFDSLLLSHVAEHMPEKDLEALLRRYLPCLKSGGRVIFISPQEAGFRLDPTHVRFVDFGALDALASAAGLRPMRRYSFPLPRFAGRFFPYNEFVSVSEKPA
jgi:SAM-dependent methyltransferase